jgi:CheY-like chemotaxis protein
MSAAPRTKRLLRVLCLEDSAQDAELVGRVLGSAGQELEMDLATERGRFEELLAGSPYDVILADDALPGFDAHEALQLATGTCPLTPFMCVSGTIGEEATVHLLKEGADDCVLKDRLARLPFAVQRAIDEKAREREQREAEERLAVAVAGLVSQPLGLPAPRGGRSRRSTHARAGAG